AESRLFKIDIQVPLHVLVHVGVHEDAARELDVDTGAKITILKRAGEGVVPLVADPGTPVDNPTLWPPPVGDVAARQSFVVPSDEACIGAKIWTDLEVHQRIAERTAFLAVTDIDHAARSLDAFAVA